MGRLLSACNRSLQRLYSILYPLLQRQHGKMILFRKYKSSLRSRSDTSISQVSKTSSITTPRLGLRQEDGIFKLPRELLQQLASYLSNQDAASFSLISYDMYCFIGTRPLATYLRFNASKFQMRKKMEIMENAFSSHWYCAWCDRFHAHDLDGGPQAFSKETKRDCAEFNSYLHIGSNNGDGAETKLNDWKDFVVTYHHIRLALHRARWGLQYGIPISAFSFTREFFIPSEKKSHRIPATLAIEARIVHQRLCLHCTCSVVLPAPRRKRDDDFQLPIISLHRNILQHLPQILVGHRNDREAHTGLTACMRQADQAIRAKKLRYENSGLCFLCATDYSVELSRMESPVLGLMPQRRLKIECWRDLGDGSNPFDPAWRSHGEIGMAMPGFGEDVVRLTRFRVGDIRHQFVS